MTEAEWLGLEQPFELLDALVASTEHRPSDRKLILFACALCRSFQLLLPEPRALEWVEVIEEFADGRTSARNLASVNRAIRSANAVHQPLPNRAKNAARSALGFLSAPSGSYVDSDHGAFWVLDVLDLHGPRQERKAIRRWQEEKVLQIGRDVFGNPFRPVAFSPPWRTAVVTALADAAYTERVFDRLPIIADALEDAGCTDRDILDHCRQPGVHVRGCWVVDLVLGKN